MGERGIVSGGMEVLEHRCRDSVVIPAPIEACFAAIADLTTYERWWTLMSTEPLLGGTELKFGVRFRFHREAGGEHFGQHDEVGGAGKRRQDFGEVAAIGCRVLPDEWLLRDAHAKILKCHVCSRARLV